ncbi:MAG: hypothetical protein HZB92_06000 [Euryarchaeota archaeon]|nr:hypothetical protein [Euryarchaeota archaeon]
MAESAIENPDFYKLVKMGLHFITIASFILFCAINLKAIMVSESTSYVLMFLGDGFFILGAYILMRGTKYSTGMFSIPLLTALLALLTLIFLHVAIYGLNQPTSENIVLSIISVFMIFVVPFATFFLALHRASK